MSKTPPRAPVSPFSSLIRPLSTAAAAGHGARVVPEDLDDTHLLEAVALGELGQGRARPNPAVGAVVVRDGKVVGRGTHQRTGGPHAEVAAFDDAGPGQSRGATLYVTLEPCQRHGRTPPCTERILAEGVTRVVVGVRDPNPLVDGRGLRRLRQSGVEVVLKRSGAGAEHARALIEPFASRVQRGRPFVVVKTATTIDGRVAAKTGHARFITGPEARRVSRLLRDRCDAILVGAGTVVADNPALTVRARPHGRPSRNPVRVVVDGRLRAPPTSTVYTRQRGDVKDLPPLVAHGRRAKARERDALDALGVRRLACSGDRVELAALMSQLGELGLNSVMVEPGPALLSALLHQDLVDELWWFQAPKVLGGDAVAAVGPLGFEKASDALELHLGAPVSVGRDLLRIGRLARAGAAKRL